MKQFKVNDQLFNEETYAKLYSIECKCDIEIVDYEENTESMIDQEENTESMIDQKEEKNKKNSKNK